MDKDKVFIRVHNSKVVRHVKSGDIIKGVLEPDTIKSKNTITVKEHHHKCELTYNNNTIECSLIDLNNKYAMIVTEKDLIKTRYDMIKTSSEIEYDSYIVLLTSETKISYLTSYIKWKPRIIITVKDRHEIRIKFLANITSTFKNILTCSFALQSNKFNHLIKVRSINPGCTIMNINEKSITAKFHNIIDIKSINVENYHAYTGIIFKLPFCIPECSSEVNNEDDVKRIVNMTYTEEDETAIIRLNKSRELTYSLIWDEEGKVNIFVNCKSFGKMNVALCAAYNEQYTYKPKPNYTDSNIVIWYSLCDKSTSTDQPWKTIGF